MPSYTARKTNMGSIIYKIIDMKNIYFILVALFFAKGATGQPEQPCLTCLPQGITFSTQSQINNFQSGYPNCAQILGYVKIMGSDISNLNGLSALTSIGGYLAITYNTALTSLSGLEGLTYVGGTLSIEYNYVLTNLNGLEGLTSTGGSGLWISDNPVLTSLGLESLVSVDGGTQGGYLSITNNALLADISGLEGLMSIARDLRIITNSSLTSLTGLEGLTSVGEDLRIEGNTSLNNLFGLDSLTSIGGSLILYSNYSLTSLHGLESLTTIGGGLAFGSNNSLTNFTGLQNLVSISGGLNIYSGNAALSSLSGLENINSSSITDLTIFGNNSLSSCDVQSICDYLASPGGTINIGNNANGCNSQMEVEAACAVISVHDIPDAGTFLIYPNPSSNHITIETSPIPIQHTFTISNLYGQEIITRPITGPITQMDISTMPNGLYFVRLGCERTVQVGKFIKQ
jgi:hypothetical protein